MRLIPAIDLINGNVVRLTEGAFTTQKTYEFSALHIAKVYEQQGFQYLHLVDLDGAKAGSIQQLNMLESIAKATSLNIDFSGGVTSEKDITRVFNAGANQVTIGSMAIRRPEFMQEMLNKYAEKIILSADVRQEKLAMNGWQTQTDVSIFEFINSFKNLKNVMCTDISKDGKLEGSATDLYQSLLARFPEINWIASGGVASRKELSELKVMGLNGVIIGKALLEQRISTIELEEFLC